METVLPPIVGIHLMSSYRQGTKNPCAPSIQSAQGLFENGAPDWDRTSNLQLRRLLLYPIELPGQ